MAALKDNIAEDLAKSLESATHLMKNLLGDIKDNAASAAAVKSKLESLSDNVATLLHDSNGRGSVITRLTLVEKEIENLEERFDDFEKDTADSFLDIKSGIKEQKKFEEATLSQEKTFRRDKLITKLKLAAVIAPGTLSLIILALKALTGLVP